jgi:tRNA U34 5-methylaminomethyl-2-thiouridine-forming methyltransferase MnmC
VLKQRIKYTSLEPYPLNWQLISQLNYPSLVDHPQSNFWFKELHISSWGQIEWLNPYFSLLKITDTIQEHSNPQQYEICFFDAFAPSKQPEIWDISILEVVRRCLKRPGLLVSYCAQGQFKRNLRALGFEVESLPGPPGKKEMTRAVLKP